MITCVSITYNNENTIRALIESLRNNIGTIIQDIIILDNNSTDNTVAIVNECSDEDNRIKLFREFVNIGYRKALNKVILLSANEIVLVINPDARLVDSSLEQCLSVIQQDEMIAYCYPDDLDAMQTGIHSGSNIAVPFIAPAPIMEDMHATSNGMLDVDVGAGAAFFIRKSQYMALGGIDENVFMYEEEAELSYRLKARGYRIVLCPNAIIEHSGQHSIKTVRDIRKLACARLLAKPYLYYSLFEDRLPKQALWWILFGVLVVEYSLSYRTLSFLSVPFKSICESRSVLKKDRLKYRWNMKGYCAALITDIVRIGHRYKRFDLRVRE